MASKWWTLLVVCLAIFMLLLDITIVNVALPSIQHELGSSFEDLQWVVDAYALALAALLLASGSIADLLGRRRIFVVGLLLFVCASLLCGLAGSPTMLNVSRGLQGIGGAMMFATSLALIAQEFAPDERGTAFGIWGATTGFAVAVGPLVGGVLTDGLGWEWIFLVNVPIGLITAAITVARVPESERDPNSRIDWAGLVTFSLGLFCLVFALIRGNDHGWTSAQILALLGAAVLLIAVFVAVELGRSQPMLDLHLFRKPAFTGAQIVAFTLHASMFAMFLYIVLYMQNVLGYSPLETGVRFLPISILSFIAAPVAGKLSERFPVRWFLGAGLLLVSIGLLLMSGIKPSRRLDHPARRLPGRGRGNRLHQPAARDRRDRRGGAAPQPVPPPASTARSARWARRSDIAGLGALLQSQGDRQPRRRPGGGAAPTWSGRSPRRGGFLGRRRGCRAGGPTGST